jgi:hypothetical protein
MCSMKAPCSADHQLLRMLLGVSELTKNTDSQPLGQWSTRLDGHIVAYRDCRCSGKSDLWEGCKSLWCLFSRLNAV